MDKEKIKEVMLTHLKNQGWPDCENPDELVMRELKPMFKLLVENNLVKYGDYDKYLLAAQIQYHIGRRGI